VKQGNVRKRVHNNVLKKERDKWSSPKNIGLLPDSLVAAHPSISKDGLTLYLYLTFQVVLVKRISGRLPG